MKKIPVTQKGIRREIETGPKMRQVSPVSYWYKEQHFQSEEEARGKFRLAYQQGLDGMGASIAQWMGLTDKEYAAWMHDGALPKRAKRR